MSSRPKLTLFAVSVVSLLAWSCASLKEASPVDPAANDAATDVAARDDDANATPDATPGRDADPLLDAGPDVDPADLGAGPLGALPSGYCCGADKDCRHRHCELVNGTKMCLDFCESESDCTGIAAGFHCTFTDAGYGRCQPASSITSCALPTQYVHGKKPLGACCTHLGDARSGTECLSGVCTQNGAQNPYFCSMNCAQTGCPQTFTCGPGDDFSTRFQCYPVASQYGCTP